ncbi:citrate synthase [Lichenicoccus sp.]|uniref:citrate synthase n=1 Tax=Lichenicoccus sp. TaxID=2781899 RepID=UPI003D0EB5B5
MYLTAEEAARSLGVSVATIYAYVSRKKIRSQAIPGSKRRTYWRDDILHLSSEASPPSRDVLMPTTMITLINQEGPFYRGRSALRLAESATIEDVAGLLWEVDPNEVFSQPPFVMTDTYLRIHQALEGATAMESVMTLLPVLERGNPRAYDLSRSGYVRTSADIMRWLAGMIVGSASPAPAGTPLHIFLAETLHKSRYADLIRRLLVLAADHEFDPTTYAVRAVANTGVTAYQVTLAGLASSEGRRLTFGRAQSLSRMLDEIATTADPSEPIIRRLREGETLPGFSQSLYEGADPRAACLLASVSEALDGHPTTKRLLTAISVARDATGRSPDFALPVVFLSRQLKLGSAEPLLFRLGRFVGWIAHAMEQYHTCELVRPRALYNGVLPDAL